MALPQASSAANLGNIGVNYPAPFNPRLAQLREWLTMIPGASALARDVTGALDAGGEGVGGDVGAWADPGLEQVFGQQLTGGRGPGEAEAAKARIRHQLGTAMGRIGGKSWSPGGSAARAEGLMPGFGSALTGYEAEGERMKRESLRDAAQTAGIAFPAAASAAAGRQSAHGELVGSILGAQPVRRGSGVPVIGTYRPTSASMY
jgi:hypothetical protein